MIKNVIKKIIQIFLASATIGFAVLTIHRSMMDYNENGVYFDGVVTYDSDAVPAYGSITGILLVITVGLLLNRKKTAGH